MALVARWQLNEKEGATAVDSIGGRNGTFNGPTLNQAGIIPAFLPADGCPSFDGTNDRVEVADHVSLRFTTAFTLKAWIYWDGDEGFVISKGKEDLYLFVYPDGRVELGFQSAAGAYRTVSTAAGALTNPGVFCIHGTHEQNVETCVYVNGTQKATTKLNFAARTTTEPLWIGQSVGAAANTYLRAKLARVEGHDSRLSAESVLVDYKTDATREAKATGSGSGSAGAKGTRGSQGKASGAGGGAGAAKGQRGRTGKAAGSGAGAGGASGKRARSGKGSGPGTGSGGGKGVRGATARATGASVGAGTGSGDVTKPPPTLATRVLSEPIDDSLFVELRGADGKPMRWSGAETDAANIAQHIKTSTSAPGGHRDASMSLLRDPRRLWPDLNLIDEVIIRGRTQPLGRNVFEGMTQQFPSQLGDGFSIDVNAVGHQELLNEDETWRALYVKLGFEGWEEPPLWRRREINSSGYPQGKIPVNVGNGGMSWEVPTETINNLEHSEVWWQAPAGVKVSQIGYRGKQSGDTAKFEAPNLQAIDSEATANGPDKLEKALTLDDTPRLAALSSARRRLMLRMLFTAATAPPGSATQRSYSELAEYGDTGVPLREIAGQLPGVYFHDALAHILSTGAPDLQYSVRADGTIVPNTSFVMPDFAPMEGGAPREAIEKGNAYFLNNWAVWDRKEFWWHPWDPDRLTWRASIAGGAQWAPVGRQSFSLINGIVVSYTDPGGVSRTAGPPGSGCDYEDASLADRDPANPYTRRGRKRYARLDVGFPLAYPTTAFQVGSIVLLESKMPQRSGTLVIRPRGAGHIPSISHPTMGPLPVWTPRSGDFALLTDWPEPEPFRIVETDYDGDSKTFTAQLDSGAARLSAILERSGSRLSLLG